MSADRLLDTISRTLASPIPRRDAVKLIAGGVGAAAAAFFSGSEARAASDKGRERPARCKKNEIDCGQSCCPHGHVCTSPGVCCPPGHVCGNLCCPTGNSCVEENGQYYCRSQKPSKSGCRHDHFKMPHW